MHYDEIRSEYQVNCLNIKLFKKKNNAWIIFLYGLLQCVVILWYIMYLNSTYSSDIYLKKIGIDSPHVIYTLISILPLLEISKKKERKKKLMSLCVFCWLTAAQDIFITGREKRNHSLLSYQNSATVKTFCKNQSCLLFRLEYIIELFKNY